MITLFKGKLFTTFIIVVLGLNLFSTRTIACSIPASLTTTNILSTSAKLNWGSASGASNYQVRYRVTGNSTWTTITVSGTYKFLTGLQSGTSYDWKVLSNCTAGGSSSYSSTLVFNTLCAIPSGLSTSNITSSSATLNWSTASCDSFLLRYYVTSTPNNVIFKVIKPGSSTSTILTGLTSGTSYSWLIRTYCMGGQGNSYSSTLSFTAGGTSCSAPSGLNATSITSSGAVLGWSAVAGASSYKVQYRKSGTSSWTSATSTTTSKSISGLTAASVYEFQLQTVCSGGTSAWTASATFTTGNTTCGVPTGLTATSITTSGAVLGWTAGSGATSYNVQYKLGGGSSWTAATSSSNSKTLTGLSSGSAYDFQVQTVCSGGTSSWTASSTFTTNSTSAIPVPDHVVILIEENHGYSQLIGYSSAPYINALANDAMSTSFTQMYGVTHPSQPSYLHLFSGSNQGVTNNNLPSSHFTTPNLAKELLNAGKTFVSYSQNLPSQGSDASSSGKYVRKHNPIANWMGTGTNQVSSSLNKPFTAFPTDYNTLPTVSFVIPDLDNDMHDGSRATGDTWFHNNLDGYVQWAKTHNSLFILVFDEDDGNYNNRIPCIFTGPMVKSGTVSTTYTLHNLLRTIEDMYGTTHAGNAANVSPMQGCWLNGYRTDDPNALASQPAWNVFPNPATDIINIQYELDENAVASFTVFNSIGQAVVSMDATGEDKGSHHISFSVAELNMSRGIYFVEMTLNEKKYLKKISVVE